MAEHSLSNLFNREERKSVLRGFQLFENSLPQKREENKEICKGIGFFYMLIVMLFGLLCLITQRDSKMSFIVEHDLRSNNVTVFID
jgi:hypothetical protein